MAIYRRGGTWWFEFHFHGQRVRKSTGLHNKREAENWMRAYRTKLVKGEVDLNPVEKAPVPTLGVAVKSFLDWSATEHRTAPNTTKRYSTASKALLAFFSDARPLDEITSDDVEKFKVWRLQTKRKAPVRKLKKQPRAKTPKNVSAVSVNRELAAGRKLFNVAIQRAKADAAKAKQRPIIFENPFSEVKFLKEENERFVVLTDAEEKLYLMACSQPLQDVAALMLDCGCRPDELYRLTRENVILDFAEPDNSFLRITSGKTKAARRTIPLSQRAFNILRKRVADAKGEYLFLGGRTADLDKPVVKLNNAHNAAVIRAGLRKFRLYDCRHTFASRHAMNGTDLVTLKDLLGHSRLEMVLRYAHASEQNKFEAIRRMESKAGNMRKAA